jgi:hypothetical protein
MRNKPAFVMLAAVACLGAAACGSSKPKAPATTTTAAAATTGTAAAVSTDPGTATKHASKTDEKRAGSAKSTRPRSSTTTPIRTATAAPPATTTTTTTVAPPVTPAAPADTFRAPIPTSCLGKNGYHYHYLVERGILAASHGPVPHTDIDAMIFVDGPYPNPAAAATAAQGLIGTEYAASGGRYEVSATLRSHANSAVVAIAACLKGNVSAKKKSSNNSLGF